MLAYYLDHMQLQLQFACASKTRYILLCMHILTSQPDSYTALIANFYKSSDMLNNNAQDAKNGEANQKQQLSDNNFIGTCSQKL